MAASWKYYSSRIFTAIIVLLIVIFFINSFLQIGIELKITCETRKTILQEAQVENHELENMSYEERQEWMEKNRERYRDLYGGKKAWYVRSFENTTPILRGDLGKARYMRTQGDDIPSYKVNDIILSYLPNTILLYIASLAIYFPLGLVFGIRAAKEEGGLLDKLLSISNMVSISMPMWWLAMIFVVLFLFRFDWFVVYQENLDPSSTLEFLVSVLRKITLPISVIVITKVSHHALVTRRLIKDELERDYVEIARGMGLPENKIIYKYSLKSTTPAITSSVVSTFLTTLPGLMLTEVIFGWPGLGMLYYNALVVQEEMQIVLGITFFLTAIYVIGYLIIDISYGALDPRVEIE